VNKEKQNILGHLDKRPTQLSVAGIELRI